MNNMRRILKQPMEKPTLRLQDGGSPVGFDEFFRRQQRVAGLVPNPYGSTNPMAPDYSPMSRPAAAYGSDAPLGQDQVEPFSGSARQQRGLRMANGGDGGGPAGVAAGIAAAQAARGSLTAQNNANNAANIAQAAPASAAAAAARNVFSAQEAQANEANNAQAMRISKNGIAQSAMDAMRMNGTLPAQPYTAPPTRPRAVAGLRMADGGMFDGLRANVNRLVGNNPQAMAARGRTEEDAKPAPAAAPKLGPGGGPVTAGNPAGLRFANGGSLPQLDSYGNPFDPEKTDGLSLGDAVQHSRLTGNMLIPSGGGMYRVSKPSTSAFFPGGGIPTMANGGDLRTGQGGNVPGKGSGDKIPAKYEPGEFVVSNDMLDAAPGLRDQLHDLRGNVLAQKGMTPEQADAKAVGGKGLRALFGFGDDDAPFFSDGGLTPYATNSGFGNSVREPAQAPRGAPEAGAGRGFVNPVAQEQTSAFVGYPSTGVKAAAPAPSAPVVVAPSAPMNSTDQRLANGTQTGAPVAEAPAPAPNPNVVSTLRQPNGVMSFSGKDIGQKPGDLSYAGDEFGGKGYGVSTIGAPGDGLRVMNMNNRLADGMRAEREAADAAAGAGQAAMGRAALAAQDRWDRKNAETAASSHFDDAGHRAGLANIAAIDARTLEATKEGGANGRAKMTADIASADRRANTAATLRGQDLTYRTHAETNATAAEVARRKAVSDERDYKAKREDVAAKQEADEASGELATAKDKREAVKAFDERISSMVTDRETGKPDEKAAAVIRNGANAFLANKQAENAAILKKDPENKRALEIKDELDKGLAGINEQTLRTLILGQKALGVEQEYSGAFPWQGKTKPTDTPISALRLKKGWLFDDYVPYDDRGESADRAIPARALRDRPDLQRLVR